MAAGVMALALGAFLAGLFYSGAHSHRESAHSIDPQSLERLFDQPLADLNGTPVSLSRWRGKPLIVNFWATWCPPCLAEMPGFSRLQVKYPGVQFVGIAADTDSNVRKFAEKMPVSYPILLGSGAATSLMGSLGNPRNALPFTIALDAAGQPRHVRLGTLDEAEAERLIDQLLEH